jgi:hypothetical protein
MKFKELHFWVCVIIACVGVVLGIASVSLGEHESKTLNAWIALDASIFAL